MNGRRNVLIFKTVVETRNGAHIARLMNLIPGSADLQPLIRKRFARTVYDPKTKRDYWIAGNDDHVACLMITGIGSEEVPKIRALLERPGECSFDLKDLASLAARITGGTTHVM
jgi:hypothetical protein